MKILTFSDIRSINNRIIYKIIDITSPDIILYAGDDLVKLLDLKLTIPTYYVNGNDDKINIINNNSIEIAYIEREKLDIDGIDNIDPVTIMDSTGTNIIGIIDKYSSGKYFKITKKSRKVNNKNLQFLNGLNNINYNNETITIFGCLCSYGLESHIIKMPRVYADIYLSHLPPKGVLDLSSRFGIKHIGSLKLRDSIIKYQPKIVICGHSHLWGGNITKLNDSIIINVSSHDSSNTDFHYAIIDTNNDFSVNIYTYENDSFNEYYKSIRGYRLLTYKINRIPRSVDTILKYRNNNNKIFFSSSVVNRLGTNYIKKIMNYSDQELLKLKKDAETFSYGRILGDCNDLETLKKVLSEINTKLKINTNKYLDRVLAKYSINIVKKISLNPYLDNIVFLDVETGLSTCNSEDPNGFRDCNYFKDKLWLIGTLYHNTISQFFYPQQLDEFKKFISDHNIDTIVCWSMYDRPFINCILNNAISKKEIRYVNLLARASNSIINNTYSLHSLYKKIFGSNINNNIINGYISGLYADHLILNNNNCKYCNKEKIVNAIIERNRYDLLEMYEICIKLFNINS